MAEATNTQMQVFVNDRLRVRAEQLRALFNSCADDKAAIDDVFARASGINRWTDARADGPPKMLISGGSASPDDILNFNTALDRIAKFKAGTFANVAEANGFAALWAVLQDACVRPI